MITRLYVIKMGNGLATCLSFTRLCIVIIVLRTFMQFHCLIYTSICDNMHPTVYLSTDQEALRCTIKSEVKRYKQLTFYEVRNSAQNNVFGLRLVFIFGLFMGQRNSWQ